jgi:hypothetical protein
MKRFSDDREALDFVAAQIAEEAQRENVALSDVERKMLYFSETAWTLPDIWDVSDKFDKEYQQDVYEKKISLLIRKAVSRTRQNHEEDYERWKEAIRHLGKEDRYLLVMVDEARLGPALHHLNRQNTLWVWGPLIAAGAVFASLVWLFGKWFPETNLPPTSHRGTFGFAIWLAMVCMLALYGLVWLIFRVVTFSEKTARAMQWIFGFPKRGR